MENKPAGMSDEDTKELFTKEHTMVKIHWLYDSSFRVQVSEETKCTECIHAKVCSQNMERLCVNYWFGTSTEKGCLSCTNHYARYDIKKPVPCFYCPYFMSSHTIKEIKCKCGMD